MAVQIRAMDYLQSDGKTAPLNELARKLMEYSSGAFKEISLVVAGDIYKLTGRYDRAKDVLRQYLEEFPPLSKEELEKYQKRRNELPKQQRERTSPRHPRTVQREKAKETLERLEITGRTTPSFDVTTLDGKTVSPADYRGKVLLIDFWATGRPACVNQLPQVKEVYRKYHPGGLEILGMSLDQKREDLEGFVDERSVPWKQVFLQGESRAEMAELYGVPPVPAMFLVDRQGKVRAYGMTLRGKGLEKNVAKLMQQSKD
jgi:peroxiredoxin